MGNLERNTLLTNAVKSKIKLDTEVGTYRNNVQISMEKKLIDQQYYDKLKGFKAQELDWA